MTTHKLNAMNQCVFCHMFAGDLSPSFYCDVESLECPGAPVIERSSAGLLEFTDSENRKEVGNALQAIWFIIQRKGIVLPDGDPDVNASRRRLVYALAQEFLGEEVEFEELT